MYGLIFQKILEQERNPVFTAISVLTTFLVWIAVIVLTLHDLNGFAALVQFPLTVIVLLIGFVINGVAGLIASSRGEYLGGQIASLGIILWFVTLCGLMALRGR